MKEKTADIDILQELINGFDNLISYKQKQAISTLIAENKELKEEIEELKNKNKKLQDKAKELIFEKQELTSALLDSTPNDKIKAKIEEYEEQKKDEPDAFLCKRVLQSLLEKE